MKKGLQFAPTSRLNAKSLPKSAGFQRKRSRSEIHEENEQVPPAGQEGRPKILFPERAKTIRKPKLDIDVDNLPRFAEYSLLPEVSESFREEMLRQQDDYAPDPDYLLRQPQLSSRMRAVLLDWMFEVGQEYGLKRDTLHVSINYVDRFLSYQENPVQRNKLQLVGVTALWIASKMEEILPPPVSDFAAATDGGCSQTEIIEMEGHMLEDLSWKLLPSTPFAFANMYLQVLTSSFLLEKSTDPVLVKPFAHGKFWMIPSVIQESQLVRVMEVLDLALLDIDSLCFSPSVLAATAVLSLVERSNSALLNADDVLRATRFSRADLEDCTQWFSFALELAPLPSDFQHRRHVVESTLKQELPIIQRHNPAAILLFKEVFNRRQCVRHPAAERSLKKRRESLSMSDESDEDPELRVYAVVNRRHLNLINEEATARSYSPMTQISMRLENTSFNNEPRGARQGDAVAIQAVAVAESPQRHIVFEDSD